MDMEGPINALSASPDGNLIIAAGRDGNCFLYNFSSFDLTSIGSTVLKIVSVAPNFEFSVYKNLRMGRNLNLNFSSNDVKWHPNERMPEALLIHSINFICNLILILFLFFFRV